jgi:hypothetical protein
MRVTTDQKPVKDRIGYQYNQYKDRLAPTGTELEYKPKPDPKLSPSPKNEKKRAGARR